MESKKYFTEEQLKERQQFFYEQGWAHNKIIEAPLPTPIEGIVVTKEKLEEYTEWLHDHRTAFNNLSTAQFNKWLINFPCPIVF